MRTMKNGSSQSRHIKKQNTITRILSITDRGSRYQQIARIARANGGIGKIGILGRTFWCISDETLLRSLLLDTGSHVRKGNIVHLLERILGHSIFTAEGSEWNELSYSSKLTLGNTNSRRYYGRMIDVTNRWVDSIWRQSEDSAILDLRRDLYYLNMDIISAVLLGCILPGDIRTLICSEHEWIRGTVNRRLASSMLAPAWIPSLSFLQIYLRKKKIDDLLSPVLSRAKQMVNEFGHCLISDHDNEIQRKALCPFSKMQNADFVKTLFFTGIRTTAVTLEWIILYMVTQPTELEMIRTEIDEHIGSGAPSPEGIAKLVHMERFIKEVMRRAPIAHTHVRQVKQGFRYGDHFLRRGDVLLLSVFGFNHDEKVWDEPDSFNPDRFCEKGVAALLFPFGLGAHTCPGQHLAYQSITIALVLLIQRFRIEKIESVQLEPCSFVLLEPSNIQSVKLVPR